MPKGPCCRNVWRTQSNMPLYWRLVPVFSSNCSWVLTYSVGNVMHISIAPVSPPEKKKEKKRFHRCSCEATRRPLTQICLQFPDLDLGKEVETVFYWRFASISNHRPMAAIWKATSQLRLGAVHGGFTSFLPVKHPPSWIFNFQLYLSVSVWLLWNAWPKMLKFLSIFLSSLTENVMA